MLPTKLLKGAHHIRNTKLKATSEQIRKTNKQKLIDTDNSMVVTRRKGKGRLVKGKGDQIHGDRRFHFRW